MPPRANSAFASRHYRMLELQSRVNSANSHGLVGLLYEELLQALDLAIVSASRGSCSLGKENIARALAILIALEASLDLEKGGELACTLARIYRACSHTLREVIKTGDVDKISEIRNAISNIAYAWQAIADT